jgi:SAM-dependent methyltransferase
MTDEPPEHDRERQPHQFRKVAESFGADAGRYDRTRPPYPAALVDRVIAAAPGRDRGPAGPGGPDVLDVGCGTGIAARQFQEAGCSVLGVWPRSTTSTRPRPG